MICKEKKKICFYVDKKNQICKEKKSDMFLCGQKELDL